MSIKRGDVVSHSEAVEWGVGKVVEVNSLRVSIQFNNGVVRKITSSHFNSLQPAEPSAFLPIPEAIQKGTAKASPRKPKTAKVAKL